MGSEAKPQKLTILVQFRRQRTMPVGLRPKCNNNGNLVVVNFKAFTEFT